MKIVSFFRRDVACYVSADSGTPPGFGCTPRDVASNVSTITVGCCRVSSVDFCRASFRAWLRLGSTFCGCRGAGLLHPRSRVPPRRRDLRSGRGILLSFPGEPDPCLIPPCRVRVYTLCQPLL